MGVSEASAKSGPGSQLGLTDMVSLVIGAVIGADIYVVAAQGAMHLGPAALVAWVAGGVMAIAIGLCFAECALVLPSLGGSYAYVGAAFGKLPAFLSGWCLYLAELVGSAVFPLAFTRYLAVLVPDLQGTWEILIRVALILFVAGTNYVSVVVAGRVNDLITLAKVVPLVLLVLFAIPWALANPGGVEAHLIPFAPLGWAGFIAALTPIFWAYAGFEVASLPADEVRQPARTLPIALGLGILITTVLYLLINAATVIVLPWQQTAKAQTPLVDAAVGIFSGLNLPTGVASTFMVVGAAISILGVTQSMMLALARLALKMAEDGYLPSLLSHTSPRFGTPAAAILFQAVVILGLSFVASIQVLISASVLYLSIVYLGTSLASLKLGSQQQQRHHFSLPLLRGVVAVALISSMVLMVSGLGMGWTIGLVGLALGAPFYLHLFHRASLSKMIHSLRPLKHSG